MANCTVEDLEAFLRARGYRNHGIYKTNNNATLFQKNIYESERFWFNVWMHPPVPQRGYYIYEFESTGQPSSIVFNISYCNLNEEIILAHLDSFERSAKAAWKVAKTK